MASVVSTDRPGIPIAIWPVPERQNCAEKRNLWLCNKPLVIQPGWRGIPTLG